MEHTFPDHGYPPAVWDKMSEVPLTRKALVEFDRRKATGKPPRVMKPVQPLPRMLRSDVRRLQNLAKNGGPDLSKLRGVAHLAMVPVHARPAQNAILRSSGPRLVRRQDTMGPYDPHFRQMLIDNGVYPDKHDHNGSGPIRPKNLEEIRQKLAQRRNSLSPPEGEPTQDNPIDLLAFDVEHQMHGSELGIIAEILPVIEGQSIEDQIHDHPEVARNKRFTNLKLIDPNFPIPRPGKFYGATASDILPVVRADLSEYIVPSTTVTQPVAPNCFIEAKHDDGRFDVLEWQAMYAGAIGARAMWQLQNYRREGPEYDGNAYTIVATYHAYNGDLQLFTMHPAKSPTSDRTEYHMTFLEIYQLRNNVEGFYKGAAALRNAKDFCKTQRDQLIAGANLVSRTTPGTTASLVNSLIADVAAQVSSKAVQDSLETKNRGRKL